MGNNENSSIQIYPLWRALGFVVLIILLILLIFILKQCSIPQIINISPTGSMTPSATPTIRPSATPTITLSPTLTPEPSRILTYTPYIPVTGPESTNIPDDFTVGPWHDDTIVCDRFNRYKPINITGVDISGGTPPYEIVFSQFNNDNIIARIIATTEGKVEFKKSIVLKREEYLRVIITFGSSSVWIEDLNYPLDYATCPRG